MLLTFKEAVTVDNRHKKKEAKKKRSGQAPSVLISLSVSQVPFLIPF